MASQGNVFLTMLLSSKKGHHSLTLTLARPFSHNRAINGGTGDDNPIQQRGGVTVMLS